MKTARIVSFPLWVASAGLCMACGSEPAAVTATDPATTPGTVEAPELAMTPSPQTEIEHGALFSEPGEDSIEHDVDAEANQAPQLLALSVTPADVVRTGDDITVMPSAEDPDGGTLAFRYRWTVNGQNIRLDAATLPSNHFERGDEIELTVEADDGEDTSFPMTLDPVIVANSEPRISSAPGPLDPDGTFRYQVGVEDPDSDRSFRYELRDPPEGMRIDPIGGGITWTPLPEQAGVHTVTIAVDDRHEGLATQSFDLTIEFNEATPAAVAAP